MQNHVRFPQQMQQVQAGKFSRFLTFRLTISLPKGKLLSIRQLFGGFQKLAYPSNHPVYFAVFHEKNHLFWGSPIYGSSAGWLPQQHSAMLRAMAFRFTLHADGGVMIDDAREHGGRVAMFNGFSRCFRPVIFFSNGMANLSTFVAIVF